MRRINITVPDKLAEELKKMPNISKFVSETLIETLKRRRKEEFEEMLGKAYLESAKEDKEINSEWEAATLEGWD
jgi:hypothetical protein